MEGNTKNSNISYKLLSITLFGIIILLTGTIFYLILNDNTSKPNSNNPITNNSITLPTLQESSKLATTTPSPESIKFPLNKEYQFPLRDGGDQIFGEFSYAIINYELTNQVILNKLYKALVTNDKEILALHIEITNDNDQALQIIAGDYVRLTKNNDGKLIAPDIEEDPVEVRPHSTISTSLGFSISKEDINLIVQVGELNEDKDYIQINKAKH